MCPNFNPAGFCKLQGFPDHRWIAGVKTTGYVGGIDERHDRAIVTHLPRAKALSKVTIEGQCVHELNLSIGGAKR